MLDEIIRYLILDSEVDRFGITCRYKMGASTNSLVVTGLLQKLVELYFLCEKLLNKNGLIFYIVILQLSSKWIQVNRFPILPCRYCDVCYHSFIFLFYPKGPVLLLLYQSTHQKTFSQWSHGRINTGHL